MGNSGDGGQVGNKNRWVLKAVGESGQDSKKSHENETHKRKERDESVSLHHSCILEKLYQWPCSRLVSVKKGNSLVKRICRPMDDK